jgi:threonylcarbamoyladenosine tRNA methylthiotransferase MtaB
MPQLERREIKARAQALREKGQQALNDHLRSLAGRELDILMENPTRGRAPQYAEVGLSEPQSPGEIIRARVTDVGSGQLEGTLVA